MKKIAFIIDNISNVGGTQRVLNNLVLECIKHKYSVSVYSIEEGNKLGFKLPSVVNINFGKGAQRFIKLINITREIKKITFDNVIIISMGKLSFQILPLLKLLRIKSRIISCDHVSIESFNIVLRKLKILTYTLADEIGVLTEHDKNYIQNENKKIKNLHVLRNISSYSTQVHTFEEAFRGKKKVVLAVGRLTAQKNFGRLLTIWSKLPENLLSDWTLEIAGEGEERAILEDEIQKLGLSSSVKLLGNIGAVNNLYRDASVLCMTSRYEGLPMVLIEAKDFALPVVSFNCKTGPKEIIDGDGFLIDYDNDDLFREKLQQLMMSDSLRFSLSKKAFSNRALYSNDFIFKKWLQLLR